MDPSPIAHIKGPIGSFWVGFAFASRGEHDLLTESCHIRKEEDSFF